MFRKYSCGCVGIPDPEAPDQVLVVYDCTECEVVWGTRSMKGQSHEPCGPDEVARIRHDMQHRLADGARFKDLQLLLGIPRP